MNKFTCRIFLLLVCFGHTLNAQCTLSLNQVLALTLLNNPELKAFSYDLRAADANILQAGLWPNPDLDVETEDLGHSEEFSGLEKAQTTILLSQLIELGG